MKELLTYTKELTLENSISEISSISLECTYNEEKEGCTGTFLVEGSYKSFESIEDEEDFKFDLPFEEDIENLEENSLSIEISDFNYNIDANKLTINIDYTMEYSEKKDVDEEELNRFIESQEVDFDTFNLEDSKEDDDDEEKQEDREEVKLIVEEDKQETEINNINMEETVNIPNVNIETYDTDEKNEINIENAILNNISKEEKYITYHIHVCEPDDTLDSLSKKYNLPINEIIEYNNIDEVRNGVKLILPVKDE